MQIYQWTSIEDRKACKKIVKRLKMSNLKKNLQKCATFLVNNLGENFSWKINGHSAGVLLNGTVHNGT